MDSSRISVDSFVAGARPRVVGHRGNPDRFPDNTLPGIMSGLEVCSAVEVDVRLTHDGHLVLSHDRTVRGLDVAATVWPELADLELGKGHRLCLLDEILVLGGHLDLEIKNLPGEPGFDPHGNLALQVASRAGPGDVVTSFYWPDIDLVRRRAPDVVTGILVDEGGSAPDAVSHAARQGHDVVALHQALIDKSVMSAANEAGIAVVAWTVNRVERARELSQAGLAAIISDHPKTIIEAFREEGA